jgi:hypothetical protein
MKDFIDGYVATSLVIGITLLMFLTVFIILIVIPRIMKHWSKLVAEHPQVKDMKEAEHSMSPEDQRRLEKIAASHKPETGRRGSEPITICGDCRLSWPCDVGFLLGIIAQEADRGTGPAEATQQEEQAKE